MTDAAPTAPTLVYACSGCSSAAQLANHLAVRLDRQGDAEMSCIAGVGGRVKSLVRVAQRAALERRPILAIDGCPLACVKQALAQVDVVPTHHFQLAQHGIRKLPHADFDPVQASEFLDVCTRQVRGLNAAYAVELAQGQRAPVPA